MAKVNKSKLVREYMAKHPLATAREIASDLDITPQYVHQIRRVDRKKSNNIEVPKEWEDDAQQMAEAIKTAPVEKATVTGIAVVGRLPNRVQELETALANSHVIIKYLEKRLEELSVRR